MNTTRRKFVKQTGAALASTALVSQIPMALLTSCTRNKKLAFGFQVWTLREKLIKDFAATLSEMSEMGYSEVEMCSPLGYSGAGFEPLNKMTGSEMKRVITDSGLSCTSSHYTLGELRENLDNRIEWADQLGMKQMILSTFWLPEDATVDDYRRSANELNGIAEKTKAAGIQMGFHNHHFEFETRGDKLIYDALLEEFDADLVKMQFQVAVVDIGYKAADYFRKYEGRFISAHLADWSSEQNKQVPLGEGIVDWNDFFETAKDCGVKNFFVEMAPETFKPSADFLKEL
ncbi:MAG: sugar phosphate isomerase/epimerase [Bacteroidota bacterium]